MKWFTANADKLVHYVTIHKNIFINKYGLTKLIAQSKEAAAFQLQDYIYEVVYKLETTGKVTIKDVESRDKLCATLSELQLYKTIENENQVLLKQSDDTIRQLTLENTVMEEKLKNVTGDYDELIESYKQVGLEMAKLRAIVKKLSATSSARDRNQALSSISDIESAIPSIIEVPAARTYHKKPKKITYYLLKSVEYSFKYDSDKLYEWKIVDKLPELPKYPKIPEISEDMNYKDYSELCQTGVIEAITDHIFFMELTVPPSSIGILNFIIDTIGSMTEGNIVQAMRFID
jgi:hypothetical protein